MKKLNKSTFFKLLTWPLIWLFQSCSPLGEPVDEKISNSHYYTKDKKDVIYSPGGNWFEVGSEKIGIEDITSLEILSSTLCKDKNKAYFKYNPIDDVAIDINSLRAAPESWSFGSGYAMDKNSVYYFSTSGYSIEKSKIIKGANPEHFTLLNDSWGVAMWGKDDKHHFFENEKIDVDYNSFKVLSDRFGKDKHKAFCYNYNSFQQFEVDITSFEIVGDIYAKDKYNIYHFDWYDTNNEDLNKLYTIAYLNFEDVTTWDYGYVRVADNVYFAGEEIPQVDASSFQSIKEYYNYAKDKAHVYFNGNIIENADPITFTWDQKNYCYKDKNHSYSDGKMIETK